MYPKYKKRAVRLLVGLVFFAVSSSVDAATSVVRKYSPKTRKALVTHAPTQRWRKGDKVCVQTDRGRIGCGQVIRVSKKRALIRLGELSGMVKPGQQVVFAKAASDQLVGAVSSGDPTAQEKESIQLMRDPSVDTKAQLYDELVRQSKVGAPVAEIELPREWMVDFTVGANVGINHLSPLLHAQVRLAPNVAVGLVPVYFANTVEDTSVTAWGGFATVNYYKDSIFRGFWGQVGGGFYSFEANQTGAVAANESSTSLAIMLTAGWRFGWDQGLNIGFAGGAQYVSSPSISIVNIDFSAIQPTVIFDIGLNF